MSVNSIQSPVHSPGDIQSHLYHSFLTGQTADISLTVTGSFSAVYRLHRVVLIQAEFFRALFTSEFRESADGPHGQRVNLRFDDVNITRAAFEICIARLYGGGPTLHVSPSIIPTFSSPLTPMFTSTCDDSLFATPKEHHPATPRFLLSLIATSIYLSIPALTSQALTLVLKSIGPYTVVRYLNFAMGKGVGEPEEGDLDRAVGLEEIGKEFLDLAESPPPAISPNLEDNDADNSKKLGEVCFTEGGGHSRSTSSISEGSQEISPSSYGRVSDKIGETCACWLARWAGDILPYEESLLGDHSRDHPPLGSCVPDHSIAAEESLPSQFLYIRNRRHLPPLWGCGGLLSFWVRGLISSDDFFVKGEWERYNIAKRVVELRRRSCIDIVEEAEWEEMFQTGIYYSHMSLDNLLLISEDVSPITKRPYVSLTVLQSAYWNSSILQRHITNRSSAPVPTPPPSQELGITLTTSEIESTTNGTGSHAADYRLKPFFPVPADSSVRLGDSSESGYTMEQLFRPCNKPYRLKTNEANFFGIQSRRRTGGDCAAADASGNLRWSPHQPFRLSVEFWGAENLKERSRLHSHTVWYAGSLFNVYTQAVQKKGMQQLGIYLHRQSTVDPIPPASVPFPITVGPISSRGEPSSTSPRMSPARSSPPPRATISAFSQLPHIPGTPTSPLLSQPAFMSNYPTSRYRDSRAAITAYFSITCFSPTGSSMTRFASAPDIFAIAQSWGWKSSTLSGVRIDSREDWEPSKEVSLRATIVIGVV